MNEEQVKLIVDTVNTNYLNLDKKVDEVVKALKEQAVEIRKEHDELLTLKFSHYQLKETFEKSEGRQRAYGIKHEGMISELNKKINDYILLDTDRHNKEVLDEADKEKKEAIKKADVWKSLLIKSIPYIIGAGGTGAFITSFIGGGK